MYDLAQEREGYGFHMIVQDWNADGWDETTMTLNVEIYGEKISGWSTADTVTWGLGGAAVIGFIVTFMAKDQFDIGGYVRDLPQRRRRR